MADIGTLAVPAPPIPFPDGDRTYQVQLLKQTAKIAFEDWVKGQAWKALYAMRQYAPADEWQEDKTLLERRMRSGYFGYHGQVCQEAQNTQAGSLVLASILFGVSEDEMIEIASRRGDDVRAVLSRVIAESVPDPKKPAAGPSGSTAPNA